MLSTVNTNTAQTIVLSDIKKGKFQTPNLTTHVYPDWIQIFILSLTISKPALFEHLTEALTQLQIALVLGTFDELFELIGAGLLLLRGLLLVHVLWLGLVRLLKETRQMMGSFTNPLYMCYYKSRFLYL